MCMVSVIVDHYRQKWDPQQLRSLVEPFANPYVQPLPTPLPKMPTKEEIDEFRVLLEKARKYDKDNGQPDCEMDSKKKALKEIADHWGIEINFL